MATASTTTPVCVIIVISYNSAAYLPACLGALRADRESIEAVGQGSVRIVLVDNASQDGSASLVRQNYPDVEVLESGSNLGFAAANNLVLHSAPEPYALLVNPDAVIKPGSLRALLEVMAAHPQCGMAGGLLLNEKNIPVSSVRRFPSVFSKLCAMSGLSWRYPRSMFNRAEYGGFDHDVEREVDWVPGALVVIRKTALQDIGAFDARYFLYFEETDLCLRMARSINPHWTVRFTPYAMANHVGGGSSKTKTDTAYDTFGDQLLPVRLMSEAMYFRKNHGLMSMLGSLGVEGLLHGLRWLLHCRPGHAHAARRKHSASVIRAILSALRRTKIGTYAPPAPW